jgi:endonuclease YncB( thermonuclease family)
MIPKSVRNCALTLVTIIAAFAGANAQQSTAGEVVEVIDAKTIVLQRPNQRIKVELQYVDVPASDHEMHATVTNHLRELLIGKTVEYRPKMIQKDRSIGLVLLAGTDISQQMLRDGAARHMSIQVSGQEKAEFDTYADAEAAAKTENRGIWSASLPKTAWEIRAKTIAASVAKAATPSEPVQPRQNRVQKGKWGDVNPALGDVGALINGFNAETQTGYLSTSVLGVTDIDEDRSAYQKTAVDFTYLYKEGAKGRTGTFYFTILSAAKTWRYAKNNHLTFLGEDAVIARPKRVTFIDRDNVHWEQLRYQIPRKAMERIVNGGDVRLSIGREYIQPFTGVQHLLYNMLALSK